MTSRQLSDLFASTLKELARAENLVTDALLKLSATASLPGPAVASAQSAGGIGNSSSAGVASLVSSADRIESVLMFTSICEQMVKKMHQVGGADVAAVPPSSVAKALRKTRQSVPCIFSHNSVDLYADEVEEMIQCIALAAVARQLELSDGTCAAGERVGSIMTELSEVIPKPLDVARLFVNSSRSGAVWLQPQPLLAALLEQCADKAQGPHQILIFAPLEDFCRATVPSLCDTDDSPDVDLACDSFVRQFLLLVAGLDVVANRRIKKRRQGDEGASRVHRLAQNVWMTLCAGLRKAVAGTAAEPRRVSPSSAAAIFTKLFTPLQAGLAKEAGELAALHRTGLYWILLLVEDLAGAEKAQAAGARGSGPSAGSSGALASLLRQNNGQVTIPVLKSLCEERHALLEQTMLKAPSGHLLHRLTYSTEDDDGGDEQVLLVYVDKGSIFARPATASAAFSRIASFDALFSAYSK